MNKKCDDRYNFQINRIPTWIPDLIFKYQNTMNALYSVFWVAFLPGQAYKFARIYQLFVVILVIFFR
jgi:hypothetical protein